MTPDLDVEKFPQRHLTEDEFAALKSHERVERVEQVLDNPAVDGVISFVMETTSHAYGLHSDHRTAEWFVTTSDHEYEDTEYERTKKQHLEWVADDIARVNDSEPPDIDVLTQDIPETITVDCPHCDSAHEAFDPVLLEMGQMEYNAYCETAGNQSLK